MNMVGCPKCAFLAENLTNENFCDGCGFDFTLHKMAQDMSDRYYNIGLERAKSSNLSAALKALNISLQISKSNTKARNLLGLCYYRVGRVGEALRQWRISSKIQPEENQALGYLETIGNDLKLLEKYSEALVKYNEALTFAEKYSEDLSEIRLKRAIEIIPNFVDAMNLLALHRMKNNDKTKAAALIEKVLEIDNGNVFAQKYYFEIFQKQYGETKPRPTKTAAEAPKPTLAAKTKSAGTSPNPFAGRTKDTMPKASPISGILLALAGMGAMFLFMYFLIMPGIISDREDEFNTREQGLNDTVSGLNNDIYALNQNIEQLESDVSRAQGESDSLSAQVSDLTNTLQVHDASRYLSAGDPLRAVERLEMTDIVRLSLDMFALYEIVRAAASPLAEVLHLERGTYLFNAGNHAEARSALLAAAALDTPNSVASNEVLFILGQIEEAAGNYALAYEYFSLVAVDHPTWAGRQAATTARNRVGALQ